jgi:hypothetical protein
MRLRWKPSPEMRDTEHHDATDEATGITAVVACDDPASPEPWVWYLTNCPVVSREPVDSEGPAGRALTKEAAMEAAEKALPTPEESADHKRQEEELYESEQ